VGLTKRGQAEASEAGRLLGEVEGLDLAVLHTSLLTRAVQTANLVLASYGREWLPVRRHWRLNERHYGALQGLNKKETSEKYGADQVKLWRRSYSVRPPALAVGDPGNPATDERYGDIPASELPLSECLQDVVTRMIPYWVDYLAPDLQRWGSGGGRGGGASRGVLVVAHGNSIRALRKHLEGISDDAIVDLEIPTGVPYLYRMDDDLAIVERSELGDAAAIAAAAEEVRRQAG